MKPMDDPGKSGVRKLSAYDEAVAKYDREDRVRRLKEAGIVVAFLVAAGLVAAVVVFLMGRPT